MCIRDRYWQARRDHQGQQPKQPDRNPHGGALLLRIDAHRQRGRRPSGRQVVLRGHHNRPEGQGHEHANNSIAPSLPILHGSTNKDVYRPKQEPCPRRAQFFIIATRVAGSGIQKRIFVNWRQILFDSIYCCIIYLRYDFVQIDLCDRKWKVKLSIVSKWNGGEQN